LQCQVAVPLFSARKFRPASTASIWFGGHLLRDPLTANFLATNWPTVRPISGTLTARSSIWLPNISKSRWQYYKMTQP
jgi:hypothetical protein